MRALSVVIVLSIVILSSLLATIDFSNYLFIPVTSYIFLTAGISIFTITVLYIVFYKPKKAFKIRVNATDILLASFMLYIFIIYALSPQYNGLYNDLILYVISFSIYVVIRLCLKNDLDHAKKVLHLFVFIGLVETLHGILQLAGILPNYFPFKFGGAFGNPGDLANLLVVTFTISLGLFYNEKKKKTKTFLLLSVMLHLLLIIASFARTAWIACVIISIVLTIYFKYSFITQYNVIYKLKRNPFLTSLIIIGITIIIVFSGYKLYSFKENSADGRLFIWKVSKELIIEKPLSGHGYNSYQTVQRLAQIDYFKNNPNDSANGWLASETAFAFNDYLQMVIEYGFISLLLFSLLIARSFFFKSSLNGEYNNVALIIARLAIATILICSLFSYPLQNPTIILCFFILLGIVGNFDPKDIIVFSVNKRIVYAIFLVLILSSLVIIRHAVSNFTNGLKWKHACALVDTNLNESLKIYNEIFDELKHNRSFIINYCSVLYKEGNSDACISYFEKYGYLCVTSDNYMAIGNVYKSVGNYTLAEKYYYKASFLVPHKFVPKYCLFLLYKENHQMGKAKQLAQEISEMGIKIYSETVRAIKTDINSFLNAQNY